MTTSTITARRKRRPSTYVEGKMKNGKVEIVNITMFEIRNSYQNHGSCYCICSFSTRRKKIGIEETDIACINTSTAKMFFFVLPPHTDDCSMSGQVAPTVFLAVCVPEGAHNMCIV